MTFAAMLAGRRKRISYWFTIEGIETIFKEEDTIDGTGILGGPTRAELVCIERESIKESAAYLDRSIFGVRGGAFSVSLVERYGSTALRDLIQPRQRPTCYLTTSNLSTSATTLGVNDSSLLSASSGTIYLGRETITYASRPTGTSIAGCTRAMYGSTAQKQKGSTNYGPSIYEVPPSWRGRRLTLYGTFLDENGVSTASNTSILGVFVLDATPSFSEGKWSISCSSLADEFASKKLYVGVADVKGHTVRAGDNTADDDYRIYVDDAAKFKPADSGFPSYAMVKMAGGLMFFGKIDEYDNGTPGSEFIDVILDWTIRLTNRVERINSKLITNNDEGAESVRHVCTVGGSSPDPLMWLLVSVAGDGTYGGYDVLPGVERGNFQTYTWRMGAGIAAADIDVDSFDITSGLWWYILDDAVTVGDVLKDWCLSAEAFWYVSRTGKLTAARMADVLGAGATTIDSSALDESRPVTVEYLEDEIKPMIRIECNYSPIGKRYLVKDTTSDGEMSQRYPNNDETYVIQSKSIGIDVQVHEYPLEFCRPVTMSRVELESKVRRMQKADGRGRLVVKCRTRFSLLSSYIGNLVELDLDVPDLEGGTLQGRTGRIMSRMPDYQAGTVDLEIEVMDTVFVFAPSATVTAVSTTSIANDTVTLSTTEPDVASTSPTQGFYVGQILRLWDVSAGSSQLLTIAALPTASSIRFTAGVTGAVETGVDWLTWGTLGTSTAGAPASGYEEAQLAFFMGTGGPAAGEVRRWR